jgi:lipopolysaccharide transport system ATP-binding protein
MSKVILKAENISKQYRLGTIGATTLRDDIARTWSKLTGKEDPTQLLGTINSKNGLVWALKDINFEIKQGDTVGIIGKNGAGKSTLLKILSKVTSPTTGKIKVKGRIASLLEVGTGFHPELTGKENIFLNGAILGMTKAEVQRKLDEIIDFSGVEKYIDTPVKRYSSGMYVRLAFAVAAHLEPEILIVDEVLAVGDAEFQKKCLGKMKDVSKEGRTVLFVSHNMAAVRNLCSKGILIQNGGLIAFEEIEQVINLYQNSSNILISKEISFDNSPRRLPPNNLLFDKIIFNNTPFKFNEKLIFDVFLKSKNSMDYKNLEFGLSINDKNSIQIIHISNKFINKTLNFTAEKTHYRFEIDNILYPGFYSLTLFLRTEGIIQDWVTEAVYFEIEDGNPYEFSNTNEIQSLILPQFNILEIN